MLSALNLVAIYAVVLAAAGSADLGLLAVFLAIALVPAATIWLRTIPALFALAATCASIRLRSRRWMVGAGVLAVIAFLFAMDFGVYSAIVAFIVAARMRMGSDRGRLRRRFQRTWRRLRLRAVPEREPQRSRD